MSRFQVETDKRVVKEAAKLNDIFRYYTGKESTEYDEAEGVRFIEKSADNTSLSAQLPKNVTDVYEFSRALRRYGWKTYRYDGVLKARKNLGQWECIDFFRVFIIAGMLCALAYYFFHEPNQ